MEASIIKRGEKCINTIFHHRTTGLTLEVKVHPSVEDFFRTLSGGETVDVRGSGRQWEHTLNRGERARKETETLLLAYDLQETIYVPNTSKGSPVSLDLLSQPLTIQDRSVLRSIINISYLRLVGISEGTGVEFRINGVYSYDAIKILKDQIEEAQRLFHAQYLKPVDISLSLFTSVQEIAL